MILVCIVLRDMLCSWAWYSLIILFVFQQSNTLKLVEWDVQEPGWPVERTVPVQLRSGQVTVLYPYGNLFYAAADALEKSLPSAEGSQRAVVILLLRGSDDLGSTVIGALHRYAQSLYTYNGKLMLTGVSPALKLQLQRTGMVSLLREENIFIATETLGEAGNAALRSGQKWLDQAIRRPEVSKDERWRREHKNESADRLQGEISLCRGP